jgi:osmoprotectant transport system substrate-binding protein
MFTRVPARRASALAALGVTALLVGCSADGNPLGTGESVGSRSITIGSLGSPESEILAQVYGQVLERAGYTVDYDLSIGAREVFLPALRDGSIDLIPDYAGALLYGADAEATATTIEEIRLALPDALEPLGLEALEPAEAEDADALVVTAEFAAAHSLVSIGDLAPIASTITLGSNTGFEGRWFARLNTTYGVTGMTFKAIDDFGGADTLQNLLDNVIQVADIHTTSPSIEANKLVVLEDPANLIPAQNVIPLLDTQLYSDELAALLNEVSAVLTTSDLADLNALYAGEDQPSAAEVATEWLTSKALL